MRDFARTAEPVDVELEKLDDMLAGLADEHSDYRSAEELRGGVLAARAKFRQVWQQVSLRTQSSR